MMLKSEFMSLFLLKLRGFYRTVKGVFVKPEIIPEVLISNRYKLPNEIFVVWNRDDGYIVGNVKAGDKEFVTQGKNADDFIEMVNESVMAIFDIPADYIEPLAKSYLFYPNKEELNKLKNISVVGSSFGSLNAFRPPELQPV